MKEDPTKRAEVTLNLPQGEDLKKFYDRFPVRKILEPLGARDQLCIKFGLNDLRAIQHGADSSALDTWISNIKTLTSDAALAYAHSLFYAEAGIPDEPYRISPGNNGQSEQFFPNFKPQNFDNQNMFRFYSEITISKIFSALDNIGAVLLFIFGEYDISNEDSPRSHFHTILHNRLKHQHPQLAALDNLTKDTRFEQARKIRNDIIHNRTPLKLYQHFSLTRMDSSLSFESQVKYLPHKKVLKLMDFLISDALTLSIASLAKILDSSLISTRNAGI